MSSGVLQKIKQNTYKNKASKGLCYVDYKTMLLLDKYEIFMGIEKVIKSEVKAENPNILKSSEIRTSKLMTVYVFVASMFIIALPIILFFIASDTPFAVIVLFGFALLFSGVFKYFSKKIENHYLINLPMLRGWEKV